MGLGCTRVSGTDTSSVWHPLTRVVNKKKYDRKKKNKKKNPFKRKMVGRLRSCAADAVG